MSDELQEFFRCDECKRLRPTKELHEIKQKNVIILHMVCDQCFIKMGGEKPDDSKPAIRTDEGGAGENRPC